MLVSKTTNLQNILLFSPIRSSVTKSRKFWSNESQQQRRKIEREEAGSCFWYSSGEGKSRLGRSRNNCAPPPQSSLVKSLHPLPSATKLCNYLPFLPLSLSPLWSVLTGRKIRFKHRLLRFYIPDFWKYQAMEKSHDTRSLKTKIKTLPSSAIVRLLGLLRKAALRLSWMLHPAGQFKKMRMHSKLTEFKLFMHLWFIRPRA